jgi:hypothetical protein
MKTLTNMLKHTEVCQALDADSCLIGTPSHLFACLHFYHTGISAQVLNAIDVIELENLIKLNVAKGKAFSTLGKAKCGAKAMQSALDVSDLYDVVV